jgi:Subtilase family
MAQRMVVWVVDSAVLAVPGSRIVVPTVPSAAIGEVDATGGRLITGLTVGSTVVLECSGPGLTPVRHTVLVSPEPQSVTVGLPAQGELTYPRGDSRFAFRPEPDRYLLTVHGAGAAEAAFAVLPSAFTEQVPLEPPGDTAAPGSVTEAAFLVRTDRAGVEDLVQNLEAADVAVQFGRPVVHGADPRPHGLTATILAGFEDALVAGPIADKFGCTLVRVLVPSHNVFVLRWRDGPEYAVLDVIEQISATDRVVFAEPDLFFFLDAPESSVSAALAARVPRDVLHNHLGVRAAWKMMARRSAELRGGSPDVVIGVVDLEGMVQGHPALSVAEPSKVAKIVDIQDLTIEVLDGKKPTPLVADHGMQCAGSAAASDTARGGLLGVAPNCRVIGVRCSLTMHSRLMVDIYRWLSGLPVVPEPEWKGFPATSPHPPAAVISSSWRRRIGLDNAVGRAFEEVDDDGCGGTGTVQCWAIGNEGYCDFTATSQPGYHPWASHARCLAVGATIPPGCTTPVPTSLNAAPDGSTAKIAVRADERALYSQFGREVFLKPELTSTSHTATTATGQLLDPVRGCTRNGGYAATFGGTSHAAPVVAGAVALMRSMRPGLTAARIRQLLLASCVRVHQNNPNPDGAWRDPDGRGVLHYSPWYGEGRLDVRAAVAAAIAAPP